MRSLVTALLVPLVLAIAGQSTSARAAEDADRIRIVERLTVDADASDLPRVNTLVRIRASATRPEVQDLLTLPRGGTAFADAERRLLAGLGVYPRGWWQSAAPFAPGLEPHRPRVKDGVATLTWGTSRNIQGDERNAPFGHWRVSSDGSRVMLWLEAWAPRDTTMTIKILVRGALVERTSEPPLWAVRGHPLMWRMSSHDGFRGLGVTLEAQGDAARYLTFNRSPWSVLNPLLYALSGAIASLVLLWLTRRRALVVALVVLLVVAAASLLGAWLWERERVVAAVLLATPLFALGHQVWEARRLRDERERLRGVAHLGLALALTSAVMGALARGRYLPDPDLSFGWLVITDWLLVITITTVLAVVVGYVVPHRRWVKAAAGLAAAGIVAAAALSLYWWHFLNIGEEAATALGVYMLLAVVLLAVAAFVGLIAFLWPAARPGKWTFAAAGLLVLGLLGSWIRFRWIGYDRFLGQHDLLTGGPSRERFSYWLQYDAYEYAVALAQWIVDFAPFLTLAGVLAYLYAHREPSRSALVEPPLLLSLIVLVFATFVGTTNGELYFYRVPVPFFVAFAALYWIVTLRKDEAVRVEGRLERVGRTLVLSASGLGTGRSEARPPRWLDRLRSGFLPPGDDVSRPDAIADARAHALEPGPYSNWWANGVAAVRWGALVAILPAAHYVYVLWSQRHGDIGLDDGPFALLQVMLWVINEYAFWLVGSFTLGALYLRLPGRTGVVKGLVVGAVFALAQGAAELLPGRYDVLSWPFLAAEAVIVLAVVGLLVDLTTMRERGMGWVELLRQYDAAEWQLRLRYVSVALPIVFVLAQQVISGSAQQTITEFLNAASTLQVPNRP